ncbi:hypothetical protein NQ318_011512 [Aromia moschata]|uniref:DUF4817 domain-containing protein n=1 Tax=Aromia moschata TaxID=1265417 RepID=A0AAV8XSS7_9CUCU|nr:hypothetical protein NQ318_011512 [Aromia moschata]
MSYLTDSLKIEILMMIGYGDRARTQCEVVRLFRETHPDLPPLNQGTISKIEAQYREMGHVRKVPSKRQAVVDDDTKLNLLLALEENPITPARQLALTKLRGLRRLKRDGRRAAEHVAGGPHVAELGPQGPLLADLVDGAQGHHQARHEQIGHCQREDEIIGHVLEVPLQEDCRYHEDVACNKTYIGIGNR